MRDDWKAVVRVKDMKCDVFGTKLALDESFRCVPFFESIFSL